VTIETENMLFENFREQKTLLCEYIIRGKDSVSTTVFFY